MRPRFMNRGSGVNRSLPSAVIVGFNEAPIHESGKCCATTLVAAERLGRLQ